MNQDDSSKSDFKTPGTFYCPRLKCTVTKTEKGWRIDKVDNPEYQLQKEYVIQKIDGIPTEELTPRLHNLKGKVSVSIFSIRDVHTEGRTFDQELQLFD